MSKHQYYVSDIIVCEDAELRYPRLPQIRWGSLEVAAGGYMPACVVELPPEHPGAQWILGPCPSPHCNGSGEETDGRKCDRCTFGTAHLPRNTLAHDLR